METEATVVSTMATMESVWKLLERSSSEESRVWRNVPEVIVATLRGLATVVAAQAVRIEALEKNERSLEKRTSANGKTLTEITQTHMGFCNATVDGMATLTRQVQEMREALEAKKADDVTVPLQPQVPRPAAISPGVCLTAIAPRPPLSRADHAVPWPMVLNTDPATFHSTRDTCTVVVRRPGTYEISVGALTDRPSVPPSMTVWVNEEAVSPGAVETSAHRTRRAHIQRSVVHLAADSRLALTMETGGRTLDIQEAFLRIHCIS